MRSSGRLIAVSRPAQPIANVSVADADSLRLRARAPVVGLAPLRDVDAVGHTANRCAAATRIRTRSSRTSSLTAMSMPVKYARPRSTGRKKRSQRWSK